MQAASEGLSSVLRNLLPLAGALLLGTLLYFASACTCVGWIAVVPLLFYGAVRMLLESQQGHTKVASLWSGTQDFVPIFFSFWGLILVYILLVMPTVGISVGLTVAKVDPLVATAVTMPLSVLYSLVLVRLHLAPFLLVDRKEGVLDSIQRSWTETRPVWGKMIALQLLAFLLMSPTQVMAVGMQMLQQDQPAVIPPEEALAQLGPVMLLYFGMLFISVVVGTLVWSIFASAYRQLVGIQSVQAERA